MTRLLVERLLSTPTERLKAAPDEDAAATDADTLSRLFELDLAEDSEDDDTPALREARPRSLASPSAARNR